MLLMVTMLFAISSTFVSCKDYDDDINANTASIDALRTDLSSVKSSLEDELSSTKSSLETEIANAKSNLQTAIDGKADAATVEALQSKVNSLETDLAGTESRLQAQISAAAEAIENLQSDVKGAAVTLAALTGDVDQLKNNLKELGEDLSEEVVARQALERNLEIQTNALNEFKNKVSEDNKALQEQIDALKEKTNGLATDGNVKELQEKVKELSNSIQTVNSNIDALTVLIERALTSIALVPELYVDGIETIEFLSVKYTPLKSTYKGEYGGEYAKIVNAFKDGNDVNIDNGLTEATYRLNPTTVNKDCYDESGIEFVSTVAKTRSVTPVEGSPIMFNGVKSFDKGLMTIYVKKNPAFTESLNRGDGEIYIASLKVPRNAKKYEAADIYSENSRLSEKTITPRIAALDWQNHSTENASDPNSPFYHYSDYATIYGSRVDGSPLALVAKKINYDETFNLLELVTGCYDRGNGTHNQITKEALKTYGLTFRFSIPKTPYINAVDNNTDQQQFATVTPEGMISSKTPAGVTDNKAVVGKEPIVQIDLVDSVHSNKLVDRRYLKIKWSLQEKEPVQLKNKSSEAVLNCNMMTAEYTWQEFVDEVYAKANLGSGLSQSDFERIYPFNKITVTPEGWTTNWSSPKQTSAPASGSYSGCVPVFSNTANEHGDALVAKWELAPSDVKTIYNNNSGDTKTFKAKVELKSAVPSENPDLWFEWTFTIKLPALPTIAGYYDQYWNQIGAQHDVLPVQYNTPAQTKAYCVYDNNLMNAFTYDQATGFIVKGMPSCGTWDMQFSYNQSVNGYKPNYNSSAVRAEANSAAADPSVFMSANKYVDSKQDIAYADFAGYSLMKGTAKALVMNWKDGHKSWDGDPTYKTANLFSDHNNAAIEDLLNPLGANSVKGADGTIAPERTHNKKVNMTVWATLNDWNYIPVLSYDICLIAPLRINAKESIGNLQDGVVSGDVLDMSKAFTLDDFRGYLVANTPDNTFSGEQNKYTASLWKYYEVQAPVYNTNAVRYTFKNVNGDAKIDNSLSYANSMTAAALRQLTNGNIDLSMNVVGSDLIFKNNGGSNIEGDCYAYIPVSVKYGFGTLTATLKVHIYPHGQKPANAKRH